MPRREFLLPDRPPVSPALLDDLLEGRIGSSSADGEALQLLELATSIGALAIPGPTPGSQRRIRGRFNAATEGRARGAFLAPLRERVAAAVLLLGLAGGAASYATGVSPAEAAANTAEFVRSVIVNLNPNGDSNSALEVPSPTPELTALPATATATPPPATTTPPPTPAAEPDPTASEEADDDSSGRDDSGREDNSGPGSANSGRGSDGDDETPEPGDDD